MNNIILATNNTSKIIELKKLLNLDNISSLKDNNIKVEIIEDGETFEENAIKKASEISKLTNKICIADDSGLCIDTLNGFPGVKTARFLGTNASQLERNEYILQKLQNLTKEDRKAKAITCIALCIPNCKPKVFTGILEGYISEQRRGTNGFGFDEIFELENGKTLAELSSEEKNEISSRRLAIYKLKTELEKIF